MTPSPRRRRRAIDGRTGDRTEDEQASLVGHLSATVPAERRRRAAAHTAETSWLRARTSRAPRRPSCERPPVQSARIRSVPAIAHISKQTRPETVGNYILNGADLKNHYSDLTDSTNSFNLVVTRTNLRIINYIR